MLFSYMDDTCQWGPYVRPLSPLLPLSPCHSSFSLLSLHCCLRCSSTPADHTMSSSARSWLSAIGSLNLGLLPSSAVRHRSTPLWITYVHCFSIEFDPGVSLFAPRRSFLTPSCEPRHTRLDLPPTAVGAALTLAQHVAEGGVGGVWPCSDCIVLRVVAMLWSLVLTWVCIDVDAGADHVLAHYDVLVTRVFNFSIAKFPATTEITEFREIRPKFWWIFYRD